MLSIRLSIPISHSLCLQATLETYLKEINVSISEFYQEVRDAQNETHDPYLLTFIDCLLASADYESFYKVMTREGKCNH